jgi:DUF1680 family protein
MWWFAMMNQRNSKRLFVEKILPNSLRFEVVMMVSLIFGVIMFFNSASFGGTTPQPKDNWGKIREFDLSDVRLLGGPFLHAMKMDERYLLELEPDRLLAPYFKSAGLQPKAPQYGGWESTQLSGAILGHYLSAASMMYAATGNAKLKERIDYIVDELKKCQDAVGTGYIGGIPDGQRLWNEVESGIIVAHSFNLDSVWSPWYNLHKVFAGLRDAYRYADNETAKGIMEKFGEWAVNLSNHLNDEQFTRMIKCEYGGMNEVMADLYEMTGKSEFLDLAKRFNDEKLFGPLAEGVDSLAGNHVNMQIPKIIGAAKEYEVDGNETMKKVALYFWDEVTRKRIYINGEMGNHEYFGKLGDLPNELDKESGETCNVYNMLKLTRHLMEWNPKAEYADYYERALYNDILASQDPETGMMTYFISLEPGFFKTFSTPFNSFWCCVGTGMENHAKYDKFIYMHGGDSLYVNLFIPSILRWKEKDLTVRQDTRFPYEQTSTLSFKMGISQKMTVMIRRPYWAGDGFAIKVNGKKVALTGKPGTYESLTRTWHDGDMIEISLPMRLHVEPMVSDSNKVAIMYGPLVLAGELGGYVPLPYAKNNNDFFDLPTFSVPDLAIVNKPIDKWAKPVADKPLHFKTVGVGQPNDVELAPLYEINHQHYTVYWSAVSEK